MKTVPIKGRGLRDQKQTRTRKKQSAKTEGDKEGSVRQEPPSKQFEKKT